jgi:hypothetical protein
LKNAGIAYDKCIIEPFFYADNCSAEGRTNTPYGEIFVKWERKGTFVELELSIPNGVDATLILPKKQARTIQSGTFKIQL